MRVELDAAVAASKKWAIINGSRSISKIRVEEVPPFELAALREALFVFLYPFTSPDTGQIGFSLRDFMSGIGEDLTLEQFATDLIRTADVLGLDRALSVVTEWVKGEPANYSCIHILRGITVSEPLALGKGIRFEKLSNRSEDLVEYAERFSISAVDLMSQPVMHTVMTVDSVFYMPEGDERYEFGRRRRTQPRIACPDVANGQSFSDLLNALSLACGSCVQVVSELHDYSDEMLLMRGGGCRPGPGIYNLSRFGSGRISVGESKVTPKSLENAKEILGQMSARCDLDVAISRWKNSMIALDMANCIIDLRTVLESLYCCGEKNELKLRATLRGALHLAPTPADRKEYYANLRALYNLASKVVHGRSLSNKDGVQDIVTWSYKALRRAIIKRLEEGRKMDWKALMLGLPLP